MLLPSVCFTITVVQGTDPCTVHGNKTGEQHRDEALHLKNRSNMMQTTQETLTTAQNEHLQTLLRTHEAG